MAAPLRSHRHGGDPLRSAGAARAGAAGYEQRVAARRHRVVAGGRQHRDPRRRRPVLRSHSAARHLERAAARRAQVPGCAARLRRSRHPGLPGRPAVISARRADLDHDDQSAAAGRPERPGGR